MINSTRSILTSKNNKIMEKTIFIIGSQYVAINVGERIKKLYPEIQLLFTPGNNEVIEKHIGANVKSGGMLSIQGVAETCLQQSIKIIILLLSSEVDPVKGEEYKKFFAEREELKDIKIIGPFHGLDCEVASATYLKELKDSLSTS